jgi:hypothetical protein
MAAPNTYTLEKVLSASEPWQGKQGQMVTYEILLAEQPGQTLKAHVPADIPAPVPGEIQGWVNDGGKFGLATGKPSTGGGGSGSRSNGTGGDFERRPDHPVQMQRALHTSALSTAVPLIEQMLTIGVVNQPKTKDEYLALVQGVATWVQQTYPAAVLEQAAKADG